MHRICAHHLSPNAPRWFQVKLEWTIEEERNNATSFRQQVQALEQEIEYVRSDHVTIVDENQRQSGTIGNLQSALDAAEAKAKSEMRVLSREIKSLRKEAKEKDKTIKALGADLHTATEELGELRAGAAEARSSMAAAAGGAATTGGTGDGIAPSTVDIISENFERLIQEVEVCRKKQ